MSQIDVISTEVKVIQEREKDGHAYLRDHNTYRDEYSWAEFAKRFPSSAERLLKRLANEIK